MKLAKTQREKIVKVRAAQCPWFYNLKMSGKLLCTPFLAQLSSVFPYANSQQPPVHMKLEFRELGRMTLELLFWLDPVQDQGRAGA